MKKILVPSDLSKISENALKVAVQIAKKSGGQIDLVNFHEHPFGKTFSAFGEMKKPVSDEEQIYTLQLVRKNYADLNALAENSGDGVEIKTEVYDESFEDGVEEFIKEHNIDLVVMGTTGEENAKEFFTGNHAQQVIELAPCPVLTVRENDVIGNFSKIVLGVEFKKDDEDNFVRAISYINDFSSGLASEVHLVHVTDDNNKGEVENKLEKFAKDHSLLNYKIAVVNNGDEQKGLLNYGHQINAGAVAVLTHADGGFFRVFQTNMSEEMNKHADMPVLTINLHKI
ncbi:universal stress protein [Fulvivirga aurantia]|uniref:universal stress protein n=1 Tax=Fulvivirga aurantia TaxID=2529383 RepID=UPI00162801BE|nr:universal stress protein [Fulvivirga aurantia]